jgi:pyruvate/2-oxoglutarate dehydrogenase complex dihydrolipoamide dehydrogenase (E3) component
MYATGRKPKSTGLGLEALGIGLDDAGAVQVDEFSQTSVPSIYAVGDVTNRVNLTPVAIREGMAFVETALKGNPTPVDHALIPTGRIHPTGIWHNWPQRRASPCTRADRSLCNCLSPNEYFLY